MGEVNGLHSGQNQLLYFHIWIRKKKSAFRTVDFNLFEISQFSLEKIRQIEFS